MRGGGAETCEGRAVVGVVTARGVACRRVGARHVLSDRPRIRKAAAHFLRLVPRFFCRPTRERLLSHSLRERGGGLFWGRGALAESVEGVARTTELRGDLE